MDLCYIRKLLSEGTSLLIYFNFRWTLTLNLVSVSALYLEFLLGMIPEDNGDFPYDKLWVDMLS